MSIRLLDAAETELDEAIAYYNALTALLGETFLIEVLRTIDRVASSVGLASARRRHTALPGQPVFACRGLLPG